MALDGDEVDDDDDRDMFCIPPTLWVNGVYIPQRRRGRGGESPRVGVANAKGRGRGKGSRDFLNTF